MAIIARKGREVIPVPAGTHIAICVQVVHIGTVETEFKGKKKKENRARIAFEIPNEKHIFDEAKGEQPFVIAKEFTLSLGKKSNLRAILESWLGRTLTPEEEKNGFDVNTLLGKPAIISVVHEEKDGNIYSNLQTIAGLAKGMQAPSPYNPLIVFDYYNEEGSIRFNPSFYKLPEFLQEKIKNSDEFKELEERQLVTPLQEEEEEQDHLSNLDRASLKLYIAQKKYPIKVVKGMEDEEIRQAIRIIESQPEEEEEEEE